MPRQGLYSLAGVSPLMKYSVISSAEGNAQEKYCEFVQAGIGNPSIWDDLEARVSWEPKGLRRGCDTW